MNCHALVSGACTMVDAQLDPHHFIFPLLEILRMASPALAIIASVIGLFMFFFKKATLKEKLANVSVYVVYRTISTSLGKIILFGSLFAMYKWRLLTIPTTLPWFLATIFVMDFVYYWLHRSEHRVRVLWCAHAVHHSSEEFDLTTALRLQWIWDSYQWLFLAPMMLLGFHPLYVVSAKAIVLLYQFWIHTQKIGKLGWFDRVFNSPSNHRVHHGSNRQYIDKNYGGILMLWDHLFGSYAKEDAAVIYGLTKPIKTRNPITINTIEWTRMFADMAKMPTLKEKLLVAIKGPEYPTRRRSKKSVHAAPKVLI